MSGLSDSYKKSILNSIVSPATAPVIPTSVQVALCSADPGPSGSIITNEVVGTGYVRIVATFDVPVQDISKGSASTETFWKRNGLTDLVFTIPIGQNVAYFAVVDNVSVVIGSGSCTAEAFPNGGQYELKPGAYYIEL